VQFRGLLEVMLKAVWKRRVLRCHLSVEKVCESRVVMSGEFQTDMNTTAESKLHSRNRKKISRSGTEECRWNVCVTG